MATFIVKTQYGNEAISAEKFEYRSNQDAYFFVSKEGKDIAVYNSRAVIRIVDEDHELTEDCGAHELLERAIGIIKEEENWSPGQGGCPNLTDPDFWMDYYAFTGEHMVLTECGWHQPDATDAEDEIIAEVNAPEETHE